MKLFGRSKIPLDAVESMDPKLDKDQKSLIPKLRTILQQEDKYKRLVECQAWDAQRLLDTFQQLLDFSEIDPHFRIQLIMAMQRLSKNSGLYPSCYELKGVEQISKEPVAYGGFANIYHGQFQGREVCLKTIRTYGTSHNKAAKVQMFSQAALLWGQLSHPNILPIIGLFYFQDWPSSVSLWMDNGNINEYLKENPYADRRKLALEVAYGLGYLHNMGLVYGSLNGQDILVDNAGHAQLSSQAALSKQGPFRWQAPEIITSLMHDDNNKEDIRCTTASDVYAWGCVSFEIFVGEIPYATIFSNASVIHHVLSGVRPKCPDASNPAWKKWQLTQNIWSCMECCWNNEPSQRPSIEEIIQSLATEVDIYQKSIETNRLLPAEFRRQISKPVEILTPDMLENILENGVDSGGRKELNSLDKQGYTATETSQSVLSQPHDRSSSTSPSYSAFNPIITTSFLTPLHAQELIDSNAQSIHQTLLERNYMGTYSVHSAFDPTTIDLRHPKEEVHIFFNTKISSELRSSLQGLYHPLTTAVITPAEASAYLTVTKDGYATPSGEDSGMVPEDTNGNEDNQAGHGSGPDKEYQPSGNKSRHSGSGTNNGNSGEGGDDNNGGSEGGGDERRGGASGDKDKHGAEGGNDEHGGVVQIPFTSTITSKNGKERFSITCNIEGVINTEGVSHWRDAPSLDVKLDRLHVTSRSNNYNLSLCQVKIQASLCSTINASWSPGVVHAVDSTTIHKEQSKAVDVSATLSGNPNFRIGSKSAAVTGTELDQQPWEIKSFPLENESPQEGSGSGGMLWKYARNVTGAFPPVTAEDFVDRPTLLLGLDDGPFFSFPMLKIEVVIFWSLRPRRSKEENVEPLSLPAHLNFIHRTSIQVDLRRLGMWAVKAFDGNVLNEIPETFADGIFEEFSPHKLRLSYKSQASDLQIFLRQAAGGRIDKLAEGERSGGTPLSMQSTPIYPTPGTTPPLSDRILGLNRLKNNFKDLWRHNR